MNNVGKCDEASMKMLKRFEKNATEQNLDKISVIGGQSIQTTCKCGCMMVHHFIHSVGIPNCKPLSHSQRYYIELCDEHKNNLL